MKKIYSFFLILVSTVSLWGQSVESSGFTPNQIRPGANSTYSITLKDINGNIDPNSIPMPNGLLIVGQSRSQSYSIGTSGTSRTTVLEYKVRGATEGTYTVPEWSVQYNGKTFKIASATLKVTPDAPESENSDPFSSMMMSQFFTPSSSNQAAARQQNHQIEDSLRNNTKLEIKIPREKIYVGESVPCELVFSFEKSLLRNGMNLEELQPEIKNADAFDCPSFTKAPTIDKTSNTERILVVYNTVITPLKAGSYDISFSARGLFSKQSRMEDIMSMSPLDRLQAIGGMRQVPFEIQMPERKIEVLELPEMNKPANFTGAIGKFTLDNVSIDPDALSVGDPAIIFAKVVGIGNFGRISAPEVETANDWKSYKPKSTFADESDGQGYIGIKTFEYTVVPTKPDLKFAPKILFNYFDPETQKYVEISSKEMPVSVAPTGRSKRAQEKEAASKTNSAEPEFAQILDKTNHTGQYQLLTSPLFWGLQLTVLVLIILFILYRRRTIKLENNPAFAKRIAYDKATANYLRRARADAERNDAKAFFTDSRAALQHALAAGTDKEASALIHREACDIMNDMQLQQAHLDGVGVYFEGADAIAFGGFDVSKINLKELDKKLEEICRAIQKQ